MPRLTVSKGCTCSHDTREHDTATGACLSINPLHGACPCAATSKSMRRAQDYVAKHKLGPMIASLERELTEARTRSSRDWRELMNMAAVLLRGDPAEVEPLRAQYQRALALSQEASAVPHQTEGGPQ